MVLCSIREDSNSTLFDRTAQRSLLHPIATSTEPLKIEKQVSKPPASPSSPLELPKLPHCYCMNLVSVEQLTRPVRHPSRDYQGLLKEQVWSESWSRLRRPHQLVKASRFRRPHTHFHHSPLAESVPRSRASRSSTLSLRSLWCPLGSGCDLDSPMLRQEHGGPMTTWWSLPL